MSESLIISVCYCLVTKLCLILFVTPWTVVHQPPLVHWISQARILEWVVISFSIESLPNPGIEPESPALQIGFFTAEPPGEPLIIPAEVHYPS